MTSPYYTDSRYCWNCGKKFIPPRGRTRLYCSEQCGKDYAQWLSNLKEKDHR